jgi:heat shock protein HslJ
MRPSLDRAIAHWCRMLLFTVAMGLAGMASAAAQKAFPFGAELRLDAKPLKGSKRVPWLQFSEDGSVDIDLWCVRGRGRAMVVDKTLTIVPVSMRDDQCPQDRLKLDEEFLEKLTQVTGWRWEGFILVLDGPQPLRWRPASN